MNHPQVETTEDFYKSMLEQVNSDHTIFITVLLGIVVILLSATWWWNFIGANKRIKDEVNNQLRKQQKELHQTFKEQVSNQVKLEIKKHEQHLIMVQGDVIRSIALQAKRDGHFKHSIYWWARHLEIYLKLDKKFEDEMRTTLNWIIIEIELLKQQDEKRKVVTPLIYKKEYIIKIISQLSDFLSPEKKKIIEFLTERQEMILK
jgi:hypothetical protein